ncbi:hypothetical protein Sste5344_003811 [Sporothrix stenoceras]
MLMQSKFPDVEYPTDLTIWEWAFEDPKWSQLHNVPRSQIGGYTNAVTGERLDFHQVKDHATHLSTALVRDHGLTEQDTVSLFSHGTIWYPVAMFAVLRAGGRINGASPAYGEAEMTNAVQTAKSKFIMTVPASLKVALAAAKAAGIPNERVFLLEGEADGFKSVQSLIEKGRSYGKGGQTAIFRVPRGKTNDICGFLTFSSGTTGLPKAAFLEAIEKYKITDLTLVPSIVVRLIRDPVVNKYNLRSVQRVACGAAPLGLDVLALLQKKLPWTGFRQSYGMTESCCCLSTHPPEYYDYKYGNNGGVLLGSTAVKVIDVDTGKELDINQTGEILAKGPQIAMGYLDNPTETAETFGADGFLHTGDIGKIDENGFIYIVDRIKEMIKVKGQQVAPADLEHLLIGHDSVVDCAVIGITEDQYSSERPKAYVVVKPNINPSDALGKELMDYVKEKRVRYKWVKEIEFISEIPRNPSGKVLRRVLKTRKESTGLVVKDVSVYAKI